MDTVKQANKVIKHALSLLDEKDQNGLKHNNLDAPTIIGNASAMVNKHEGKEGFIKLWAVNEAHRLCGFVWRRNLMTEELEKEYRELPSVEDASEDYNKYADKRKVVADELEGQRRVFADEEKEMQIFQAVMNGMSKQKAEEELETYQKQIQAAMTKG